MSMQPIGATRSYIQAMLKARRQTIKPDTRSHIASMRRAAQAALIEFDNRIRTELKAGGRSNRST